MKTATATKMVKLLKELKAQNINATFLLSKQETPPAVQDLTVYNVSDKMNNLYSNTYDFIETGNTIARAMNISDDTRYVAQYANNSMKTDFLFTVLKKREAQ